MLRRTSPDLAAHLRVNADCLKHPILLDVTGGRLDTWTAPGLLLLGDAAHPMAPNGRQGINMALRDALVAANHLCPCSLGNDRAGNRCRSRQVVEERMPEIIAIQAHQRRQTRDLPGFGPLLVPACDADLAFLAKTRLLRLLLGSRLRSLQHGVVPVRLTAREGRASSIVQK